MSGSSSDTRSADCLVPILTGTICSSSAQVFHMLLADIDGVHDPALYDDRVLLGLKGTMSEAELHFLTATCSRRFGHGTAIPPALHVTSASAHGPDCPLVCIRRGVFRSVQQLIEAIRAYIDEHCDDRKPSVWTARAEDTLVKVRRARSVLDRIASE